MTIHKTSTDNYALMKPEFIAEDIQKTVSDIYYMLDCNNTISHDKLKSVSKTHLKTIAAELDTVKKRLNYAMFGKY